MDHVKVSSELPTDVKLLPGEQLLNVIYYPPRHFTNMPSSVEQLLRLTKAKLSEEIGKSGPSVASLALGDAPGHLHLYEVVFGRDSLRVALDLISDYPELARITTLALAKIQGTEFNNDREEEPGRIVHELRDEDDPIARDLTQRLGWGWPYYGSVDATLEFVRTVAAYCFADKKNVAFLSEHYQAKNGEDRTMADSLTHAIDWIKRRMDKNPEGLVEFKSVLPQGIENQVWKDSWDAYHHSDGTLANHNQGVASIEVQVTAFNALLDAARIYETWLDRKSQAGELRARAETLRKNILDLFWCDEKGGYFVLGTDRDDLGNLRQLRVRTSNMGHVLNSDILKGSDPKLTKMRQSVIKQLFSPELLNVSGIRTLASDEVRFRPGSYHCGSVWLWDTHHVAKGLRYLGYNKEANYLDRRIVNVVNTTHVFPEYVRGDELSVPTLNQRTINVWDEKYRRINKLEQPPQEVQAWTVAAILAIKEYVPGASERFDDA